MTQRRKQVALEYASFLDICHEVKKRRSLSKRTWLQMSLASKKEAKDKWDELRILNKDQKEGDTVVQGNKIITALRDHLVQLQHGRCCYCRRHLQNVAHAKPVEHVLPRNSYPQFSLLYGNLAVSCRDCNQFKTDEIWGGVSNASMSYLSQIVGREFFHPRFDEYDKHVLYSRVETNNLATSIYVGLTARGKHLCKILLAKTSRLEFYCSGNKELAGIFEKLEAFGQQFNVGQLPQFQAFQSALQDSVVRIAFLGEKQPVGQTP